MEKRNQDSVVQQMLDQGHYFKERGRYQEAIETLGQVLGKNPNLKQAWFELGVCYGMLANYEQSRFCFDRVLILSPHSVMALNNKAHALLNLNLHEDALRCCEQALAINGLCIEAWYTKAEICQRIGDHLEAIKAYMTFIAGAGPQMEDQVQAAHASIEALTR